MPLIGTVRILMTLTLKRRTSNGDKCGYLNIRYCGKIRLIVGTKTADTSARNGGGGNGGV